MWMPSPSLAHATHHWRQNWLSGGVKLENIWNKKNPKSNLLADNTQGLTPKKKQKQSPVASTAPHPIINWGGGDEEYWRKGTNHEPNNLKLQTNKKQKRSKNKTRATNAKTRQKPDDKTPKQARRWGSENRNRYYDIKYGGMKLWIWCLLFMRSNAHPSSQRHKKETSREFGLCLMEFPAETRKQLQGKQPKNITLKNKYTGSQYQRRRKQRSWNYKLFSMTWWCDSGLGAWHNL